MKLKQGKKIMQYLLHISIFAIFVVVVDSASVQTDFQSVFEDLKSQYHFDLIRKFLQEPFKFLPKK
jgi:hypothetical protein